MTDLAINIAADTLSPFLINLNSTINDVADVRDVAANVHCVTNGVRNSLPDPTALLSFLDTVNATVVAVQGNASALSANIDAIGTTLNGTRPLTDALASNLTVLKGSIQDLQGNVSALGSDMTSMQTLMSALSSPTTGIPAVSADVDAARTNMPTEADSTAASTGTDSLTALIAHVLDGNAGQTGRANLRAKLVALSTSVGAVPNLTAVADNLQALGNRVTNLRSSRLLDSLDGHLLAVKTAVDALPSASGMARTLNDIQAMLNSISVGPIRANLESFQFILGHLPDFGIVTRELNKILGASRACFVSCSEW